jgi:hypothetical protein
MSDILVQFDEPQRSADGRMFVAQVRGRRLASGLWEAWLEFHPRIGGEPARTPRMTEQLSRGDLRFWAAGITRAHLATFLAQALVSQEATTADGISEAVASDRDEHAVMNTNLLHNGEPALDPAALYRRSGEYTLRQELRSLDARQLANIISVYNIEEMDVIDLARTYEDALAERIVASVQHNVDTNRSRTTGPEIRVTK